MCTWKDQCGFQAKVSVYILVTLMVGCKVVVVEDANVEDGVVGAETKIGYRSAGNKHDHAGIGVGGGLQEVGEKG